MKVEYILIRNFGSKFEYFYGPFKSVKDARDWSTQELQQHEYKANIQIKPIYRPHRN